MFRFKNIFFLYFAVPGMSNADIVSSIVMSFKHFKVIIFIFVQFIFSTMPSFLCFFIESGEFQINLYFLNTRKFIQVFL